MPQQEWYSAQLRLVALIEGIGASLYMDQVHVFRAVDWDDAQERALAIGRSHEQDYLNGDGQRVRWRLKAVRTLDIIGEHVTDGAEVHSTFVDVPGDEQVDADATFEPEKSRPGNSI